MIDQAQLISGLKSQDQRSLARSISLIENNDKRAQELLAALTFNHNIPVIGITGPPGAGKSSLVNQLIQSLTADGSKIGIIAVDPSSPFNYGAILGDRIRMLSHFTKDQVFIRSLATRGSLGGLSDYIIEITDLYKAFGFDYILIETVGVGQSEVEIAGLADTTVVVLVPEAGDEVQAMKAGIMEVADIFVVNKADRDQAEQFAKNLIKMLHEKVASVWEIPVLKTVATEGKGISELAEKILEHSKLHLVNSKRAQLLAQKAMRLIRKKRTADISQVQLLDKINDALKQEDFNLYRFLEENY